MVRTLHRSVRPRPGADGPGRERESSARPPAGRRRGVVRAAGTRLGPDAGPGRHPHRGRADPPGRVTRGAPRNGRHPPRRPGSPDRRGAGRRRPRKAPPVGPHRTPPPGQQLAPTPHHSPVNPRRPLRSLPNRPPSPPLALPNLASRPRTTNRRGRPPPAAHTPTPQPLRAPLNPHRPASPSPHPSLLSLPQHPLRDADAAASSTARSTHPLARHRPPWRRPHRSRHPRHPTPLTTPFHFAASPSHPTHHTLSTARPLRHRPPHPFATPRPPTTHHLHHTLSTAPALRHRRPPHPFATPRPRHSPPPLPPHPLRRTRGDAAHDRHTLGRPIPRTTATPADLSASLAFLAARPLPDGPKKIAPPPTTHHTPPASPAPRPHSPPRPLASPLPSHPSHLSTSRPRPRLRAHRPHMPGSRPVHHPLHLAPSLRSRSPEPDPHPLPSPGSPAPQLQPRPTRPFPPQAPQPNTPLKQPVHPVAPVPHNPFARMGQDDPHEPAGEQEGPCRTAAAASWCRT